MVKVKEPNQKNADKELFPKENPERTPGIIWAKGSVLLGIS